MCVSNDGISMIHIGVSRKNQGGRGKTFRRNILNDLEKCFMKWRREQLVIRRWEEVTKD